MGFAKCGPRWAAGGSYKSRMGSSCRGFAEDDFETRRHGGTGIQAIQESGWLKGFEMNASLRTLPKAPTDDKRWRIVDATMRRQGFENACAH